MGLLGLAACLHGACAHDLITAAAAERHLSETDRNLSVIRSKDPPSRRALAHLSLGRILDEVRDLLNRDVAAHGKPQGLPTLYLIEALQQRGLALERQPGTGRYLPDSAHYAEALKLDPQGPPAQEARFRLLQGHFYDSFDDDPLKPRDGDWGRLQKWIAMGEALRRGTPASADQAEEGEFIVLVHYLQASSAAPDAALRARYAGKAREALNSFRERYPDSMRLPALEVLTERRVVD